MKKPLPTACAATVFAALCALTVSCAGTSTGGGANAGTRSNAGELVGNALRGAIEQCALQMAGDLPRGTRVAVVAFESESDNLSYYIMETLTGALFGLGIEVADRQNLPYVLQELELALDAPVSERDAPRVGRFLAAELVITGQLWDLGISRTLSTSAIHVETATRRSSPSYELPNDGQMQSIVAALNAQPLAARLPPANSVNENTRPESAGTFIDRGILFASRGQFDSAIADFNEALRINPDLASAHILLGRALFASVSWVTDIADDFSSVAALVRLATGDSVAVMERAIGHFTRAIELEPENTGAYSERGRAH
ncbi:MAG: tetratricopeptide repeat protein, partial [Treponema sp.]|nr:tetratricopeptide repeat protein [Treponema sp.]